MQLAELERCIMQGINPLSDIRERQAAEQLLNPGRGLTVNERLAVYRNNITSTRVRALQAIYPVCETVVGSECFRGLAREFAWQATDACTDLNVYGGQFAQFLGLQQQRSGFSQLPYLKELTMLEWYWHAAYYAADTRPFDHEAFAAAAAHPDRLRFTLAGDTALLKTIYPVREIWRRHRAQENTDRIPALETSEYLCIHRRGYQPEVISVDKTMYTLLENIQKGRTLEQLSDIANLSDNLAELLPVLIRDGYVSGFRLLPV